MISVAVDSIGIMAPGLQGWDVSVPVLQGKQPYRYQTLPVLKPRMLKPNERRRTTSTIKLALVAADDALRNADKPKDLQSVFACGEGDLDIVNQICLALTQQEKPVSPTLFHNSVHNAPAGYWSIANGYRQASTSIAGWHGSFSTALLDASVQILTDAKSLLLVAYDLPAPAPLNQLIPNDTHFSTAMLLSPATDNSDHRVATLSLQLVSCTHRESTMSDPALEDLRNALHAARALPLLQQLARQEASTVVLPYLSDMAIQVEVAPC